MTEQCNGLAANGSRCSRTTTEDKEYCWQHEREENWSDDDDSDQEDDEMTAKNVDLIHLFDMLAKTKTRRKAKAALKEQYPDQYMAWKYARNLSSTKKRVLMNWKREITESGQKSMQKIYDAAPKLTSPWSVYRGLSGDCTSVDDVEIDIDEYASATFSLEVAEEFAEEFGIVLEIVLPVGTPCVLLVDTFDKALHEYEVILPRNSELRQQRVLRTHEYPVYRLLLP